VVKKNEGRGNQDVPTKAEVKERTLTTPFHIEGSSRRKEIKKGIIKGEGLKTVKGLIKSGRGEKKKYFKR